jgi:enoyl-CoA hydratase/carnithine racemase
LADHDKLLDRANEIAKKIASKPPQALRLTKRLIRCAQSSTLDQAMQDAAALQSLCHFTDDHMEALSAMFEKRKPQFQGK